MKNKLFLAVLLFMAISCQAQYKCLYSLTYSICLIYGNDKCMLKIPGQPYAMFYMDNHKKGIIEVFDNQHEPADGRHRNYSVKIDSSAVWGFTIIKDDSVVYRVDTAAVYYETGETKVTDYAFKYGQLTPLKPSDDIHTGIAYFLYEDSLTAEAKTKHIPTYNRKFGLNKSVPWLAAVVGNKKSPN